MSSPENLSKNKFLGGSHRVSEPGVLDGPAIKIPLSQGLWGGPTHFPSHSSDPSF